MPKAATKAQLLSNSLKEYEALENLLRPLTPAQMTQAPAPGEWSVKDILAHLYEWQQMFFRWYESGLRGEKPTVPAEGYKWSQLPALNQHIYETYRDLPLDKALQLLRQSHQKTMELAESLPEAELFERGRYAWMNQNTLAAYLHANTAAHYLWARGEIRKRVKA